MRLGAGAYIGAITAVALLIIAVALRAVLAGIDGAWRRAEGGRAARSRRVVAHRGMALAASRSGVGHRTFDASPARPNSRMRAADESIWPRPTQ